MKMMKFRGATYYMVDPAESQQASGVMGPKTAPKISVNERIPIDSVYAIAAQCGGFPKNVVESGFVDVLFLNHKSKMQFVHFLMEAGWHPLNTSYPQEDAGIHCVKVRVNRACGVEIKLQ